MNKMRVIHHIDTWLNLTENWNYTQISNLPSDIRSYIYCGQTKNLDKYRLPNIYCFNELPIWQAFHQKIMRRLHGSNTRLEYFGRKTRANILHSHFGPVGWQNNQDVRRLGITHIVTFYGFDLSLLPKQDAVWYDRYRELFENVYKVLCEGPHMADSLVELGCPREKVQVHHLGIELEELIYHPRIWDSGRPLRVLICGTFVEKKGINFALEALSQLRKEFEIEVTLIGDARPNSPRSFEERERILSCINRLGLNSSIRLLGFQPLEAVISEAYSHDIFISPSVRSSDGDTEGGAPVTIIQMAASGMPIVSTRHCDIPNVILDGKTGLLADERNVEQLYGHLVWLAENPEKWGDLTRAARAHIEREFDAVKQGQRLGDIYRQAMAS